MTSKEYRKEQNRRRELAYMRMVKQTMQPKSTEERQRELAAAEEERAEKQTAKKRTENFFYYHKTRFIVAAIVLVVVGILTASLLAKPRYDAQVMLAYTAALQDNDVYGKALSPYTEDLDGNGTPAVNILNVCLDQNQIGDAQITQRASMSAYLQLGDVNLYLLDAAMYEELVGQFPQCFIDLEERYPGQEGVDGKRFLVKGTALEAALGAEGLPTELCVVFRTEEHAGNKTEAYQHGLEMLDRIVRGEPLQ